MLAKGTDNIKAYLRFFQGYSSNLKANPDANIYARRMFQEAIAIDPEFAEAYAYLAFTYLVDVRHGVSKSYQKSVDQAFNLIQKALEKKESNATVLHILSAVYLFQGKHDEAIAKAEEAYALEPNNYEVVLRLGFNLVQAGMPEKSLPYFEKALHLNPLPPHPYLYTSGFAYFYMGKYEMAIPFIEKAINILPNSYLSLLNLAICYAGVGREEEAHACVARVLRINPKITIEKYVMAIPRKDKALLKEFAELLRKAGLPD
jgi:adenylate cyclase